jgi:hypothetical protein
MFNKLFMSFIVFFIADRIPYRRKGKQGHSFSCCKFMEGNRVQSARIKAGSSTGSMSQSFL